MASDGTDVQNMLLKIYNRRTLNHNALAHVNLCKGSACASGWSTLAVCRMLTFTEDNPRTPEQPCTRCFIMKVAVAVAAGDKLLQAPPEFCAR
jgi:hypothetical protein